MLGSNLKRYLDDYYHICGPIEKELDITDWVVVQRYIDDIKPDIIIHTAAFTNVEKCETERDKAFLVNTIGTQNLVNASIKTDALFVYISSTGIYGRHKEKPYNEFDEVLPTTVHHKSKYEGEKIIQNHLNKYIIIRTGWIFGGDKSHQKNFVYKRYLEAKDKEELLSDNSQKGNPTYIGNVVRQLDLLIKNKIYGLYNCVDSGTATRFDYVKQIVEYFDLKCKVYPASKDNFQRIAPVSYNEAADNYKLNLLGICLMEDWRSSLKKYIEKLKGEMF